jgi:hypothetical protein
MREVSLALKPSGWKYSCSVISLNTEVPRNFTEVIFDSALRFAANIKMIHKKKPDKGNFILF